MKLSYERKVYLAVLGLGLVAFATDRLLLAPGSARAAEGATAGSRGATVVSDVRKPVTIKAAAVKPASGPSFAIRLAAASESRDVVAEKVRDVFIPGPAWGIRIAAPATDERAPMTAEAFAEAYRPQLIFRTTGRAIVKVGSRQCRVGDSVDGWMLAAIGRRTAAFTSGSVSLQVPLGDGAVGHAAPRTTDNGRSPGPVSH